MLFCNMVSEISLSRKSLAAGSYGAHERDRGTMDARVSQELLETLEDLVAVTVLWTEERQKDCRGLVLGKQVMDVCVIFVHWASCKIWHWLTTVYLIVIWLIKHVFLRRLELTFTLK